MSDLPLGRWTSLLIGDHWPDMTSLNILVNSSSSRAAAADLWDEYADLMQSIRAGLLSGQSGHAAEQAQGLFSRGENSARRMAQSNAVKHEAYTSAQRAVLELREALASIAAHGNERIAQIEASKEPASSKLTQIADVIMDAHARGNVQAACQGSNILDAIEMICVTSDMDTSPRILARTSGVVVDEIFRMPTKAAVLEQVASTFYARQGDSLAGENKTHADGIPLDRNASNLTKGEFVESGLTDRSQAHQSTTAPTAMAASTGEINPGPLRDSGSAQPTHVSAASRTAIKGELRTNESPPVAASINFGTSEIPRNFITEPASGRNTPPSQPSSAATHLSSRSAPAGLTDPISPLAPTDFAHSLSTSSQAGAPISTGAEAASPSGVHAAHQTPTHTSALAAAAVAPVNPMAASPEIAVAHAPIEPAAPPAVITAPQPTAPTVAPAPPPIAVATPTSTPAVLPAYGADLKAPAPTVPAAASPTPATPISAPLSGSANTLGQASVVRHQSSAPAATAAAPLTERAVAATATGSITGAAAAQATAQERLNRLLTSVARQAPELGWAVGDRDDQTTVLTTDLASGWIPPNIKIPRGVTVLEPAKRRGTLAGMLGATTLTAVHTPGQHVPPDNGDSPTFSTRPRRTADVEDLHWELTQATKWRDGLPRLAHTLARAIASGTGYLDSEVKILREALVEVANNASSSYPHTDADLIGNWQLLATIEALIEDEKTCANYHLAWFRTLSPKGSGN